MAVTAIFSVSETDLIKGYLRSLSISNGVYIKQILDEIYIVSW